MLVITGLYLFCMTLVVLYSLGQLDLAIQYLRQRKNNHFEESGAETRNYPVVTVQLPVYNEKYVVGRMIDSILLLDYPAEKLQIQILDDSNDETSQYLQNRLKDFSRKHIEALHIRRRERTGYKAGALQYGIPTAVGELIAIFDADFIPDPDFLKKTVGHFSDPQVGLVQTRWGHVNENFSLLTVLQAFGLNAHFTVEQSGRMRAGSFINFNGTAGIWRKSCIIDSGGWDNAILSEDLELSYRAQLKGWKFKYLEDVVTRAELPFVVSAIRSQQYRWTKGGAETARKLLGNVLRSDLNIRNKIHAVLHITNTIAYPLILLASILSIPILWMNSENPQISLIINLASVFTIGFFAIGFFYWVAFRAIHPERSFFNFLYNFLLFLAFSLGMSLQNSLAVIEGYLGIKSEFVRTPKFNLENGEPVELNAYLRQSVDWKIIPEALLFLYFMAGVAAGIYLRDFRLIFFHMILSLGFGGILYFSLKSISFNPAAHSMESA